MSGGYYFATGDLVGLKTCPVAYFASWAIPILKGSAFFPSGDLYLQGCSREGMKHQRQLTKTRKIENKVLACYNRLRMAASVVFLLKQTVIAMVPAD